MTAPEPRSYWQQFLDWESRAAAQGSGMTEDQMTGAAMFRSFLVNHANDDEADAARVAAPSNGLREALKAGPKNGERIYVEEDDFASGWEAAMEHVRAALATTGQPAAPSECRITACDAPHYHGVTAPPDDRLHKAGCTIYPEPHDGFCPVAAPSDVGLRALRAVAKHALDAYDQKRMYVDHDGTLETEWSMALVDLRRVVAITPEATDQP